jgi:hypothetical protein
LLLNPATSTRPVTPEPVARRALGKGRLANRITLSISPLSCEIGIDPRNDLAKSAGLQHAFLDKQSRAADAL